MMRKNSHFQNGWMGKWMNYMEICANFENGACQWWSEEGQGDGEGGGYFARLLRSAPCQKVSDFGTWGVFVIIIISPGEAAHFSQSSRLGGAVVGGGVSGCCCTLHSWTGADVHELWLSVFLKVLRPTPRRRGTFISFNFLEIFFSPFSFCFLSLLCSLGAGGFGFRSAVCVFFPWTRLKFFLIRFTDY